MVVYVNNILFLVANDIEKLRHQRKVQGQVVMHVFSLVSAERGLGQCKMLYLITIIILLVQINRIS